MSFLESALGFLSEGHKAIGKIATGQKVTRRELFRAGGTAVVDVTATQALGGCIPGQQAEAPVATSTAGTGPAQVEIPTAQATMPKAAPTEQPAATEVSVTYPTQTAETAEVYTPATTPPEYATLGEEVKGISESELADQKAQAWFALLKQEKITAGEIKPGESYYFKGATTEEAHQKFIDQTTAYANNHPELTCKQIQAPNGGPVLTYIETTNHDGVMFQFDQSGALAFAEPNIYKVDTTPEKVSVPAGLTPQFNYNPEDKHWYMFGVDGENKAKVWFNTDKATTDNLDKQWIKLEIAVPAEWKDRVDHNETLADGRMVAIAKSDVEGKEPIKRVLQYDKDKKEWLQYIPQLAGVGGLFSDEDVQVIVGKMGEGIRGLFPQIKAKFESIPVYNFENKKNEQYPSMKDGEGNILPTGVWGYTENADKAFIVGYAAGGFVVPVYELMLMAVDVPLGNGDMYRLALQSPYVKPDGDALSFQHVVYLETVIKGLDLQQATTPAVFDWKKAILPEAALKNTEFFPKIVENTDDGLRLKESVVGAPMGVLVHSPQDTWAGNGYSRPNDIAASLLGDKLPKMSAVCLDFDWMFSAKQFGYQVR